MRIRFVSPVVMVGDADASRRFYEGLLGQIIMSDHGENVVFAGGLSLWEAKHAGRTIFRNQEAVVAKGCDNLELYFESDDLEGAFELLVRSGVRIIHPVREEPWGQRTCRCYDPDGHIVEVAETMDEAIRRLSARGCRPEDISRRTSMPMEVVLQALGYPRFC